MARDYQLKISTNPHGQPPVNFNKALRSARTIDEMLGICKGIIADGTVNEQEACFLDAWMKVNPEAAQEFPGLQLSARLGRIFSDGKITQEELQDLRELIELATGEKPRSAIAAQADTIPVTSDESVPHVKKAVQDECLSNSSPIDQQSLPQQHITADRKSTRLLFEEPEPAVTITGSTFSFTGKFVSGTRQWCVDQIVARGGVFHNKPTQKTNFLVVGTGGSRDWIHTTHGRKIEQAIEYRDQFGIKIVSEEHWVKFL